MSGHEYGEGIEALDMTQRPTCRTCGQPHGPGGPCGGMALPSVSTIGAEGCTPDEVTAFALRLRGEAGARYAAGDEEGARRFRDAAGLLEQLPCDGRPGRPLVSVR